MSTKIDLGRNRVQELEHHGVLGMKWGVRQGVGTARAATPVHTHEVIGRTSFSKTRIRATGGENHPAHQHAMAAEAIRQQLHKSGATTLSNQQLQTLATRANLEQQVHQLESRRPKSIGQTFVDQQISNIQKDPVGAAMKVQSTFKKLKTA
jgi:predicted phage-related endonuclease